MVQLVQMSLRHQVGGAQIPFDHRVTLVIIRLARRRVFGVRGGPTRVRGVSRRPSWAAIVVAAALVVGAGGWLNCGLVIGSSLRNRPVRGAYRTEGRVVVLVWPRHISLVQLFGSAYCGRNFVAGRH